jgi:hypothetical protein
MAVLIELANRRRSPDHLTIEAERGCRSGAATLGIDETGFAAIGSRNLLKVLGISMTEKSSCYSMKFVS